MAATIMATYLPENTIAGDADIRTKSVLCLANVAAIPAFTPLKRDGSSKCIPATAVGDKIVGITVPGMGSGYGGMVEKTISLTDDYVEVFTHIDIYSSAINFAAITGATTDAIKDAVFDSTGINLVFAAAGF